MFFLSVFSILCLFIASTFGLSVGRDDGQFRSFFDAGNIEENQETTTHFIYKRDVAAQQCATKINPDLQKCHDISTRAAIAAKSPDSVLFNKIFGDLDQNWRNSVSEIFTLIAEKCNPSKPLGNKIFCDEPASIDTCSHEYEPTAYMRNSQIVLCPKFWDKKYDESTCGEDSDRSTIFVHEFSHMFQINNKQITDFAYSDQAKFYDIASEAALVNADSYTLFARMQFYNCDYEKRLAELGFEDKSLPSEDVTETPTSKVPDTEGAFNSDRVLSDVA